MIGIIPSLTKTYEVEGFIGSCIPIEGKLYINKDGRVYLYSTLTERPKAENGFFPIWNGVTLFDSKFANRKFMHKDVIFYDVKQLSSTLSTEAATAIREAIQRSEDTDILNPSVNNGDNSFTQCIKGAIIAKKVTLSDLYISAQGKINKAIIRNYYSSLEKINFMRNEKWNIWINLILKLSYVIKVYKGSKLLLVFKYPEETLTSGIVKYEGVFGKKDDPFKKILKVLIMKENITKEKLREKESDDYTVNNLLAALSSKKAMSAQLFSRFMKMAKLNYEILLYDGNKQLFCYKEEYRKGCV